MIVEISKFEMLYLRNVTFLPPGLIEFIDSAQETSRKKFKIILQAHTAEEFRSVFTERLAKVGFGPHYELTNEGELLEGLIDRFAQDHSQDQ